MSIVAAELIAASSGLGYMISYYRELLRTDVIVVGMITIGLIGLLMDFRSDEYRRGRANCSQQRPRLHDLVLPRAAPNRRDRRRDDYDRPDRTADGLQIG